MLSYSKTILMTLAVIISSFSFAEEHTEQKSYKNYITLGGAIADSGSSHTAMPQITFGRRYRSNHDAVDIAISLASTDKEGSHRKYYAYPKARYLHYLNKTSPSGFYIGGGLSWSKVKHAAKNQSFTGVFAEGCVGYEFNFNHSFIQMVELGVSQPAFATKSKGSHPGPSFSLSWGIGF